MFWWCWLLMELVQKSKPSGVVVVSDVDANGVGQRGAETLAAVLVAYSRSVRVITPPAGVKDAREWKRARGDGCRRASGNRRGPGSQAGRFNGFDRKAGRNHGR